MVSMETVLTILETMHGLDHRVPANILIAETDENGYNLSERIFKF